MREMSLPITAGLNLFVHSSDDPHGDQKNHNDNLRDGSSGLDV